MHRDVTPANILLARDGRVLLADFGIARLAADTAHLTAQGLMVGTVGYLSPEQVSGGDVGPAADVYALGLTLPSRPSARPLPRLPGSWPALPPVLMRRR